MSSGNSHTGVGQHGFLLQLLVAVAALLLASPLAQAQSAHAALKMNPKAYTGKRAWWYNYQYFPELTIFAQNDDTIPDVAHRFSFFANGGYSGLRFSGSESSAQQNFGFGLGVRYNYFLSRNWGFRSGFSYSFATTDACLGAMADKFTKIDQESDELRYQYSFSSVDESYKLHLLDVPLQLVFQHKQLVAGLGVKFAMPVVVSYSQTVTDVKTEAYFPQYDVWVDESWVLGCGRYPVVESQNKFKAVPIVTLATADVEYMLPLNSKFSLGLGLYADYSLSSSFSFRNSQLGVERSSQSSLVGVTDQVPSSVVTSSLLSAMKDDESKHIVPHIKYFSAGLRVSVNVNTYGPAKPKTLPY